MTTKIVLEGDPEKSSVIKGLLFINQCIGHINNEFVEHDCFHDKPRVLINGVEVTNMREILRCFDDNAEKTELQLKYFNLAADNMLKYNIEIIEMLNSHIIDNKESFCNDESPKFIDLLIAACVNNWLLSADNSSKANNRNVIKFFGKIKKMENFKKLVLKAPKDFRPLDDPTRWMLVVGKVNKVWEHESSDKLWCEEVDVGEITPRLIGSGLRKHISKEDFENRLVIVLVNMKPKNLGGYESHGMLICASNEDHSKVELLIPPIGAQIGDVVKFEGLSGEPDKILSSKKNSNTILSVMEHLHTDENMVAHSKGHIMTINGVAVGCLTLKNGFVG